ncbi:MAG: VWA domain-containing protein, partial [Planctomycetota bacterium]
ELASEVVQSVRDGDEISLVSAGSTVSVVVGTTDFAPAVAEAIKELTPTDGPTRMIEAIETARRLALDDDKRRVMLVSDFCFEGAAKLGDQPDIDLLPTTDVEDQPANAAITMLQVRRSLVDPIGYSGLVQVNNFGSEPIECRLTLKLDGSLVDVVPVALDSGDSMRHVVTDGSRQGGVLTAELDVEDALVTDNLARAVLPRRPPIPITLVSDEPSLYLESVLTAIPLVELTVATRVPKTSPTGGITVLHRIVPKTLPSGPLLVIDPQDSSTLWSLSQPVADPIVVRQEPKSPLLPHVRLTNVVLPGGRGLQIDQDHVPLLTAADGSVLMASLNAATGRTLVLSANLNDGDLPLRIAFPVLMTNAVNWFLGREGDIQPAQLTGERITVAAKASENESWSWIDHFGNQRMATAEDDAVTLGVVDHTGIIQLGPTRRVQDYLASLGGPKAASASNRNAPDQPKTPGTLSKLKATLADDDAPPSETLRQVAVNLSRAEESDLRPQLPAGQGRAVRQAGWSLHNLWFYLALLATVLILTEWWLYQRRIVA